MANSNFVSADGLTVGNVSFSADGQIITPGKIKASYIEFPDLTTQSTASTGGGTGGDVTLLPLTVKNVSGDYTIVQSDLNNTLVRVDAAINTTADVTIPSSVALPCQIGTRLMIASSNFGVITIKGDVGVSVKSPQSTTIGRRVGRVTVIKTDIDQWEIDGQLDLSVNPTE